MAVDSYIYVAIFHIDRTESGYVDNDKTLKILRDQSLILAEAGADIIAPSDMMDGRVASNRNLSANYMSSTDLYTWDFLPRTYF